MLTEYCIVVAIEEARLLVPIPEFVANPGDQSARIITGYLIYGRGTMLCLSCLLLSWCSRIMMTPSCVLKITRNPSVCFYRILIPYRLRNIQPSLLFSWNFQYLVRFDASVWCFLSDAAIGSMLRCDASFPRSFRYFGSVLPFWYCVRFDALIRCFISDAALYRCVPFLRGYGCRADERSDGCANQCCVALVIIIWLISPRRMIKLMSVRGIEIRSCCTTNQ